MGDTGLLLRMSRIRRRLSDMPMSTLEDLMAELSAAASEEGVEIAMGFEDLTADGAMLVVRARMTMMDMGSGETCEHSAYGMSWLNSANPVREAQEDALKTMLRSSFAARVYDMDG